tara:strand:+ start:35198 stop:35752 length:555 start_codon:yes stop_codon:yes gene_type:complete
MKKQKSNSLLHCEEGRRSNLSFLQIIAAVSVFTYGLTSCAPQRTITGTERTVKDSTIIREVPVLVEVPGATVVTPGINIHQLDSMLKAGVPAETITRTLIREDPETKLKVGILIDQMGNLTAVCEQQERMIETLEREVEYYRNIYERVTVEVKLKWYQQVWHDFKQLIVGALLFMAFLTIRKFI